MCADTTPSLLKAADINVSYGKFNAIRDFNLTLAAGDTLGLLGLNGAGKSTLLRVLAGASPPAAGTVEIDGMEIGKHPIEARRRIGYAPDKPPVYPEFTVTEYLTFTARLRRIAKSSIPSAVDKVIGSCGLAAVESRIIGNLSHGYQQRINLAQALVHDPTLLILDEPANGLDPAQLLEIRDLIQQSGTGRATIFSSHLLGEVQQVCDRVLVINEGQQLLDMSLNELSDQSRTTYELIVQGVAQQQDLQDLPGVVSVYSVDSKHWLVTTASDSGTTAVDQFAEVLLARGLRLMEINPVRNHLEKLFSQLTLHAKHGSIATGEAA